MCVWGAEGHSDVRGGQAEIDRSEAGAWKKTSGRPLPEVQTVRVSVSCISESERANPGFWRECHASRGGNARRRWLILVLAFSLTVDGQPQFGSTIAASGAFAGRPIIPRIHGDFRQNLTAFSAPQLAGRISAVCARRSKIELEPSDENRRGATAIVQTTGRDRRQCPLGQFLGGRDRLCKGGRGAAVSLPGDLPLHGASGASVDHHRGGNISC